MAYTTHFMRHELKFLLPRAAKERFLACLTPHMRPDAFGKTTIRSLYYDTESYRLIRHSIERPIFKEKLRLRSYETVTPDGTVFAELKRKYNGVVYKRRLPLPEATATAWLAGGPPPDGGDPVTEEIAYFLSFYGRLYPRVFLSYEREAYFSEEGDFRVTLDENILARTTDLSLTAPPYGEGLLPADCLLLELKCAGGIPLFMTRFLTKERIYKTSFSKYGTAYRTLIHPTLYQSEVHHDEKSLSGAL